MTWSYPASVRVISRSVFCTMCVVTETFTEFQLTRASYVLLFDSFLSNFFKAYDITGIKIHRITRVHNRVLRVAFDEKVTAFLAKNEETDCAYQ